MHFQDKFFPIVLQQAFQNFRSKGLFCDVSLVADGQEFQVHKAVLASASPYFRVMFSPDSTFIEAKQEKVNLHGISGSTLAEILRFLYSSSVSIDDENVFLLMEAASLLQIQSLRKFISFYLQQSLTADNCLQLYIMANLHHYHDLQIDALNFLLINFSKISKKPDFLNVPFDVLLEILSSKLLDISSEEALYEIVMNWIDTDSDKRQQHLEALMCKLNLNLIPIELLNKIKDSVKSASLQQKIDNILNYQLSTTPHLFSQILEKEKINNVNKGRHKAERAVIFAIGGESSGMASQSVECFTVGYDKWRYIVPSVIIKWQETKHTNVLPPLRCARYYAASAHDSYNAYVIGGKNSTTLLNECEVYDVRTNQWNYFQCLPEKLYASSAAFLEGELLVTGGHSEAGISDKVWKLDKARKTWTLMRPLDFPRYFHSTVTLGGCIYVLGGFDGRNQSALKSCIRFDTSSNSWFAISSMHEGRAKFGCAAINNLIYVFGGTSDEKNCLKSVEVYDSLTDEWMYESPMSIPRHSFSVAVSDHEVYCLGGSDFIHFLNAVEKFSLRTKRWHWVYSLQISRFAPVAAALQVPYASYG